MQAYYGHRYLRAAVSDGFGVIADGRLVRIR
jgi:hypothetical protein